MSPLFIVGFALAGIALLVAALFFGLHLATNEPVPLQRARLAWRWTLVFFLGTFDIWVFTRVVVGLWEVW